MRGGGSPRPQESRSTASKLGAGWAARAGDMQWRMLGGPAGSHPVNVQSQSSPQAGMCPQPSPPRQAVNAQGEGFRGDPAEDRHHEALPRASPLA